MYTISADECREHFLFNCLPEFFKVVHQIAIILLVVYVEPVPQIATDDDSAKSQVLGNPHILKVHSSEGIDMPVYQTTA